MTLRVVELPELEGIIYLMEPNLELNHLLVPRVTT